MIHYHNRLSPVPTKTVLLKCLLPRNRTVPQLMTPMDMAGNKTTYPTTLPGQTIPMGHHHPAGGRPIRRTILKGVDLPSRTILATGNRRVEPVSVQVRGPLRLDLATKHIDLRLPMHCHSKSLKSHSHHSTSVMGRPQTRARGLPRMRRNRYYMNRPRHVWRLFREALSQRHR